jgi:hypothetical protein
LLPFTLGIDTPSHTRPLILTDGINSRVAVEDAEGLTIPLGFYASKDESKDQVRHLCSHSTEPATNPTSCFRFQFDQIVDILSKKPFAAKADSKYYSNMYVVALGLALARTPAYYIPSGSMVGLLLAQISRTPKTGGNMRMFIPEPPHSSGTRWSKCRYENEHEAMSSMECTYRMWMYLREALHLGK